MKGLKISRLYPGFNIFHYKYKMCCMLSVNGVFTYKTVFSFSATNLLIQTWAYLA
jgi:hypothetical protein